MGSTYAVKYCAFDRIGVCANGEEAGSENHG